MGGFSEGFGNASLALDATRQGIEYGQQQRDQQAQRVEHQDAQKHQKMAQLASYLVAAPAQMRPQLWSQIAPQFNAEGLPVPDQWDESMLPLAQQYAQAWGVKGAEQDAATTVQASFIDAQGNRVAIMRDGTTKILGQNAPNNQIVAGDGGFFGVNKGTLQAAPVMMGGPQAATPPEAPQSAPQDVMGSLLAMGSVPGVTMTSGPRSPSHNAEVGGKPNSQHLAGTAGDYVVPAAQKAQFIALAKKGGFQAIDEGDHVHLQLPNGVALRGQLQPAAKPVAPEKAPAPTELERRVALAKQMGATPEQIKAMVVGGGQTGNAQAVKTSQATAAKLAQFGTVQRQIDRLEQAAQSIAGNKVFDGGPMDQYALKLTPQGQELEQAGAAIMPVLTALTRVPGVGSQSDLEARLASLQLPSASMPPEVNKRAIESLRAYMADLKAAYASQSKPAGQPAAPSGGWSIQAVP